MGEGACDRASAEGGMVSGRSEVGQSKRLFYGVFRKEARNQAETVAQEDRRLRVGWSWSSWCHSFDVGFDVSAHPLTSVYSTK